MKLIKLYALIVLLGMSFSAQGGWLKKGVQALKTKTGKAAPTELSEPAALPAPTPLKPAGVKLPALEEFAEIYQSEGITNTKSPKALARSSQEAKAQEEGIVVTADRQLSNLQILSHNIDQALEKIQTDRAVLLKKKLISQTQRDVQLYQLATQESVLKQRQEQLEGRDIPAVQLEVIRQEVIPKFPIVPPIDALRVDPQKIVNALADINQIINALKVRQARLQDILEKTKSYLTALTKEEITYVAFLKRTDNSPDVVNTMEQEKARVDTEIQRMVNLIQEIQNESTAVERLFTVADTRQTQLEKVAATVPPVSLSAVTLQKKSPAPVAAQEGESKTQEETALEDLAALEKELDQERKERLQAESSATPAIASSAIAIDKLYSEVLVARNTAEQDKKTMNTELASVNAELAARGAPSVAQDFSDAAQELAASSVQEATATALLDGMDKAMNIRRSLAPAQIPAFDQKLATTPLAPAKKPAAEAQLKSAQAKKASILKTLTTKLAPLKIWARKNWKEITGIAITVALIPIIGVTLFIALAPSDPKRPARNMALLIQRLQSVGVDLSQLSYNQLQAAYDRVVAAGFTITTISDQSLLRITGFNVVIPVQQPRWQPQNMVLIN